MLLFFVFLHMTSNAEEHFVSVFKLNKHRAYSTIWNGIISYMHKGETNGKCNTTYDKFAQATSKRPQIYLIFIK